MLNRLRERMGREEGFTLVELLVVMLILGILAAIAIPAFLSQREKGQDADAKAAVRTLEVAMETYSTENDGSYAGADEASAAPGNLDDIEPTVSDIVADFDVVNAAPNAAGDGYTISVESDSNGVFQLTRSNTGDKENDCGSGSTPPSPDTGGCDGGSW